MENKHEYKSDKELERYAIALRKIAHYPPGTMEGPTIEELLKIINEIQKIASDALSNASDDAKELLG